MIAMEEVTSGKKPNNFYRKLLYDSIKLLVRSDSRKINSATYNLTDSI